PIASVRVNWYRVRENHLGYSFEVIDFVGSGSEVHGVDRRAAGRHIGEIGSDIAVRFDFHPEDPAVVPDGNLDMLSMHAPVTRGLMTLGARSPPLHRHPELAGQVRAKELLGVEMHLCPESAADIGCHDP